MEERIIGGHRIRLGQVSYGQDGTGLSKMNWKGWKNDLIEADVRLSLLYWRLKSGEEWRRRMKGGEWDRRWWCGFVSWWRKWRWWDEMEKVDSEWYVQPKEERIWAISLEKAFKLGRENPGDSVLENGKERTERVPFTFISIWEIFCPDRTSSREEGRGRGNKFEGEIRLPLFILNGVPNKTLQGEGVEGVLRISSS